MTPQQGITALRAYVNGNWNHPDLQDVKGIMLHEDTVTGVERILASVEDEPEIMTSVISGKIEDILNRKENGIDCTEEESAEIKMHVKETLLSTHDDSIDIDERIQLLFPQEWGEAQDEITEKEEPEEKHWKGNTAYLERHADSDNDNSYEDDY